MKPFDPQNLEQQIRNLPCEIGAQRDRQVRDRVLQCYRQQHQSQPRQRDRRRIMFRRITKLSVAATLLIAAGLIYFFLGDGPQVSSAWAGLVERIYAVDTCSYRMQVEMDMEGLPQTGKTEALVYTSNELGMRMDNYMNGMFSSTTYQFNDGTYLNVIPMLKRVQRSQLPVAADSDEQEQGQNDPRLYVKAFLAGEHEKLGPSEINGVPVEGIKAIKPQFIRVMFSECSGVLWIEQETGWPYLLEMEGIASQGNTHMKMIFDQFQWGIPLEQDLFEPNIPSDYTITEIKPPSFSEEELIQGLEFFSDNTGGHYPSSMDMITVMQEFFKGAQEQKANVLGMMTSTDSNSPMRKISCASASYSMLETQQQDLAYYGENVTTNDANAILLRWKLDDGQYRVVYGDLRLETVSEQRLLELENQ